jgi:ribosomal protein S18 acetylase RimI-like enzyme
MLRLTTEDDVEELIAICAATGVFHPSELETVQEVFDEYFYNEFEKGHRSFTLIDRDRINGFVYVAPAALTQGTWELWWIVVRPEAQGSGHGKSMVAHVEEIVRRAKGRQLFVETSSAAPYDATRRFYERHGYAEVARLSDYYAAGDAKVIYSKKM